MEKLGIPFKDAEQLADFCGFGDLYRKSEEYEMAAESTKKDIKDMMSKLEEIRKRNVLDVID
jgi:hypothetical protein